MNVLLPVILFFCNLQAPVEAVDPAPYLRSRGVTVAVPALTAVITNPAATPAVRHAALAYLERAKWPGLAVLAASLVQAEPDPVFRRALARSGGGRPASAPPHPWSGLAAALGDGFTILLARDAAAAALPNEAMAAVLGGRIPFTGLAAAVSFDRVLVSVDERRMPGTMLVAAAGDLSPAALLELLRGFGPHRVLTNEYAGRLVHTVLLAGEGATISFSSPGEGVWLVASSGSAEMSEVVLREALGRFTSRQEPSLPEAVIAVEHGGYEGVMVVRLPEGVLPGAPQQLTIRIEALEGLQGTATFVFKEGQDASLFGQAYGAWRESLATAADALPAVVREWIAVWQLETGGERVKLHLPRHPRPEALFREFLDRLIGP